MDATMELDDEEVRIVVELDGVDVDLETEGRLATLADHMAMRVEDVAARILEMTFRDDLTWEDVEYLRAVAESRLVT